MHYDWKPEQIQLYGYSWEGKEELIPVLSPCGHIFLLPPKPHMCPLCHFTMNVQLCNKKAKELCLVSTEFAKRLTGSKGIKNIWKHRLCIFLSSWVCLKSEHWGLGNWTYFHTEKSIITPVTQANRMGLAKSLPAALPAHMVTVSVISVSGLSDLSGTWRGKEEDETVRLHFILAKMGWECDMH